MKYTHFILMMLLLLMASLPVAAQETRTTLKSGIATNLATGSGITALELRTEFDDVADSAFILQTDDSDDITAGSTNLFLTAAERTKLTGIETSATADQSDSEIEAAYNSQVSVCSQAAMEAGTSSVVCRMTPEGVGQAIAALASDTTLSEEQVEDFIGGMVTGNTETNITVTYDDTDGTLDFVVAAGGAPVDSVNGLTGVVVVDPDDLDDSSTAHKFVTASDLTNLGNLSGTNTGDQTTITGNAGTATALAANGANCAAGQLAAGVDASGAAEGCVDIWTESENTSAAYISSYTVTEGDVTGHQAALSITESQISDLGSYITATLSEEEVEDFVGGMLVGTKTGITVTYQDGSNDIDFIVDDQEKRECVRLSDVGADAATGTGVANLYFNDAITITGVYAWADTAPTGSVATIDINEAGSTILPTKLTIDATEKTSGTAATAAVIGGAGPGIAANAEITFDIDGVGSTTAGQGYVACVEYTK